MKRLLIVLLLFSYIPLFADDTKGSLEVTLDTSSGVTAVVSDATFSDYDKVTLNQLISATGLVANATYQAVSRNPTFTGYRLFVYNNSGDTAKISFTITPLTNTEGTKTISIYCSVGEINGNYDVFKKYGIYASSANKNSSAKSQAGYEDKASGNALIIPTIEGNAPYCAVFPIYIDLQNNPLADRNLAGSYVSTVQFTITIT